MEAGHWMLGGRRAGGAILGDLEGGRRGCLGGRGLWVKCRAGSGRNGDHQAPEAGLSSGPSSVGGRWSWGQCLCFQGNRKQPPQSETWRWWANENRDTKG